MREVRGENGTILVIILILITGIDQAVLTALARLRPPNPAVRLATACHAPCPAHLSYLELKLINSIVSVVIIVGEC